MTALLNPSVCLYDTDTRKGKINKILLHIKVILKTQIRKEIFLKEACWHLLFRVPIVRTKKVNNLKCKLFIFLTLQQVTELLGLTGEVNSKWCTFRTGMI